MEKAGNDRHCSPPLAFSIYLSCRISGLSCHTLNPNSPFFFPSPNPQTEIDSPLRLCEAALRELSLHPAATLLFLSQVDSGGPLVCSYWNTLKWFQVGITSAGKSNQRILTPVCSYQEWIEKETAIRGKPFLTEGVDNGAHLRVARSSAGTQGGVFGVLSPSIHLFNSN